MKGFQKLMADTWTAGRRRMANGALTPDRAISPARPHGSDNRLGRSRESSRCPHRQSPTRRRAKRYPMTPCRSGVPAQGGPCPVNATAIVGVFSILWCISLDLRLVQPRRGAGDSLNHSLMVRRKRRADKRSEKALLKSFNAAARGSGDDSDPPVRLHTCVQ